jgi:Na+-transporting NADH:ubiquinone oxidoreductase subunit F
MGESLDFEAGGYIQVDVPETVVDYKDIDVTAHPDHHKDPNTFQVSGTSLACGTLKMTSMTSQLSALTPWPITRQRATSSCLNIRIATPPWDRARNAMDAGEPRIYVRRLFSLKSLVIRLRFLVLTVNFSSKRRSRRWFTSEVAQAWLPCAPTYVPPSSTR